jgi:hypothetical protein
MNSFQNQFNSLLGIALGAKKLGTPKAPTPKAHNTSQTKNMVEGSSVGEYQPLQIGSNQNIETSATSREGLMALIAKERSLQNLYNRHEALRTISAARKGELTFKEVK